MGGQAIGSIDVAALRAALRARDDVRVRDLGEPLGVVLDCAALGALVDLAQWRIELEDVLRTLRDAALSDVGVGLFDRKAQRVGESGRDFALALRRRDSVVIKTGHHRKSAGGVADVWLELRPWREDLAQNRARLEAWAERRDDLTVEVPLVPRTPSASDADDGEALLRAILERPEDDAARAVYADWLLARGDVHGELIRLQLAGEGQRAWQLLEGEGTRLAGEVAARCEAWRFERGFVEHVAIKATSFARWAPALFARHPIRSVEPRPFDDAGLARICATPDFARVRRLTSGSQVARAYLSLSSLLGRELGLEVLVLRGVAAEPAAWTALGAGLRAPALRALSLARGIASVRVLTALASNPAVRLTSLDLNGVSEKPGPWVQLAGAPPPGRDWGDSAGDERAGFEALGHSPAFARLTRVRVGDAWGGVGEAALRAWLLGPNAAGLVELDLRGANLTAALLDELTMRRALPALAELVLDPEPIAGRDSLDRLRAARPSLFVHDRERID